MTSGRRAPLASPEYPAGVAAFAHERGGAGSPGPRPAAALVRTALQEARRTVFDAMAERVDRMHAERLSATAAGGATGKAGILSGGGAR